MNNRVVVKKSAKKVLDKLHPEGQKKQVRDFIESLKENATPAGITKMEGYTDRYRKRVGDYRVIWKVDKNQIPTVVTVTKIGPRGDVYKGKGK